MMKRWFLTAMLTSLGAVTGCHDHEHDEDASLACTNPELVSLPNCAMVPTTDLFSDEACTTLDDSITRAMSNTTRSATVTAPTEAQALPSGTPFTFRWDAPTAMAPRFERGVVPSRRAFTWRDDLARWSVLVPKAEAHCSPFTGVAYEVRFTVGSTVALRRQQSTREYTPSPAEWQRLRNAAGTAAVTMTIYTATFNQNSITSGNGPFVSAPRTFTITN